MRSNLGLAVATATAFAVASAAAPDTRADNVEEFYKNNALTIIVPTSAGGFYDTFARILQRHMPQFIPGNPNVIVINTPGGGGRNALNHFANVAPSDGSHIVTPIRGFARNVLLTPTGVRYDPSEFQYLGGWGEAHLVLAVMKTAPAVTLKDARDNEVIVGAFARSHDTYQLPTLLNNLFGTKFRVVTGYGGGPLVHQAMERGEVHAFLSMWTGWKLLKQDWLDEERLGFFARFSMGKLADLPDVPSVLELVETDRQRQIVEFVSSAGYLSRTAAAHPDTPADRAAALTEAYQKTLRHPAFIEEAAKRAFQIEPMSPEEVSDMVKRVMATPPEVLEEIKAAMGYEGQ